MSILITGGAGFIGSNFAHYWAEHHDDEIVVLDALTYAGNRVNIETLEKAGRAQFVHGDIGDQALVEKTLQDYHLTTVVNFAAESHNSLAVLDPALFFRTNVLGTQGLCEAARRVGVERFHHISTCEVYGDLALDVDDAFTEESPYQPRTPYNASKASSDHVVRCYHETYELPITITNCSNNYGPYQFPEKVIPLFISKALSGEPLPMYASTANRREWLHVVDHCSAIELVLTKGTVGGTYNVGSGKEASIAELAEAILDATERPRSQVQIVADRPGHDRRYLLDSTKLRTELDWKPSIDFSKGLSDTVSWYMDNEDWWRPLIGRSPVVEGTWENDPNAAVHHRPSDETKDA